MLAFLKYTLYIVIITASISCNNDNNNSSPSASKTDLTINQTFHKSGSLATETSLNAEGKKHGIYKELFPNGKVQVEKVFETDSLVSEKLYTDEGKILKNIVYKDGRKYGLLYSSFCMNGVAKSGEKDSLIFKAKN